MFCTAVPPALIKVLSFMCLWLSSLQHYLLSSGSNTLRPTSGPHERISCLSLQQPRVCLCPTTLAVSALRLPIEGFSFTCPAPHLRPKSQGLSDVPPWAIFRFEDKNVMRSVLWMLWLQNAFVTFQTDLPLKRCRWGLQRWSYSEAEHALPHVLLCFQQP